MELTEQLLVESAKLFCDKYSTRGIKELFRVTDGKAIGTYIEHLFKTFLSESYAFDTGNAAHGIDLPSVQTDIKVTSLRKPQSSSPFKDTKQKIYGLGYSLLIFVYNKTDDPFSENAMLDFVSCSFVQADRTADYTLTALINKHIEIGANIEDMMGLFKDKNLPGDDITYTQLANEVLKNPPKQGYLTISNALQWRLQYQRIVNLPKASIEGIVKIV